MSKRTIQKGLRPVSLSQTLNPPPGIRQMVIERMRGLMKEVLNGNQLDDTRYIFILDYLSAVVNFHNAVNKEEKSKFFDQISDNEKDGYRHRFDKEQMSALNFLVLQAKVGGQLSALEKRIKEKESQ